MGAVDIDVDRGFVNNEEDDEVCGGITPGDSGLDDLPMLLLPFETKELVTGVKEDNRCRLVDVGMIPIRQNAAKAKGIRIDDRAIVAVPSTSNAKLLLL